MWIVWPAKSLLPLVELADPEVSVELLPLVELADLEVCVELLLQAERANPTASANTAAAVARRNAGRAVMARRFLF